MQCNDTNIDKLFWLNYHYMSSINECALQPKHAHISLSLYVSQDKIRIHNMTVLMYGIS